MGVRVGSVVGNVRPSSLVLACVRRLLSFSWAVYSFRTEMIPSPPSLRPLVASRGRGTEAGNHLLIPRDLVYFTHSSSLYLE